MSLDKNKFYFISFQRRWLKILFISTFVMIFIGGLTRLTNSGLSMVDWRLLQGTIPPLNEKEWLDSFEKYQEFPEYKIKNKGMSLPGYRFIFMMEYFHRVMGRILGLLVLLPYLYLLWKKALSCQLIFRYGLLFSLVSFQGFIGWYMVKSGLVDIPRVSHYRLTLHLLLAIIFLSFIFYYLHTLSNPIKYEIQNKKVKLLLYCLMISLVLQIIYGGFTAGLKAGYAYSTFPLFHQEIIPTGIWKAQLHFENIISNSITVLFIHRWLGIFLLLGSLLFYFKNSRLPGIKLFQIMLFTQFFLGYFTTIFNMATYLASLHQVGAIVLWILLFRVYLLLRFKPI